MSDEIVRVVNSTKEQVALDLVELIMQANSAQVYETEKDVLTLYRKCYKATSGNNLTSILEEK